MADNTNNSIWDQLADGLIERRSRWEGKTKNKDAILNFFQPIVSSYSWNIAQDTSKTQGGRISGYDEWGK